MTDYTGKQLGNYRLLRSLGRGGFAEVYLGEHIHLGTLAAIKVLPDLMEGGGLDEFRREAQIIAHLRHPHIVRVLDFGVENKLPFLVMDYVPNGTLRQRYPHGTMLPFSAVVSYVKQIAQALQFAHDRKIIHRDVKPENMLLDINDQVLLSDFGISAIERSTSRLSTLKRDGSDQAGTPIYMAPEQIYGDPHPASDQYALAVIAYEWLCGARPFTGEPFAVMYQHVHAQPPSLQEKVSTISPEIEQVILKALAKDPRQRYATVLDFAKALEEAVQAEIGETFLRRLPPAPAWPQEIAAAPVQLAPTRLPGSSTTLMRSQPALAESIRSVRQRKGIAPYWIVSLLALAIILIAGSAALLLSLPTKYGQAISAINAPQTATAIARVHAGATATAAVNAYNAAATNGIMDGFDARHTRVNPYEKLITPATVPHLRLAWKTSTGGSIGSAATIADNIVYISSNGGKMFALRATTGTPLWSANIGSYDFGNAPTFANSGVYMGAPDYNLYAFNALTGDVLWKAPTLGRIGSSPTLANGVIYIGSDDHNLYAFNASTGKHLWSYSTGNDIRSSPAVANGIVYVGSDDGNLYAFTIHGNLIWHYHTGNVIRSTPAVANGIVYVGSDDDKLYAFDAANGTLRWSMTTEGNIDSSPAIYNGVVYVGSKDGKLRVFDAANGKLLWIATTGDSISSSPIVADGVLFIGSNDDHLYAYAAIGCGNPSCQPLWSFRTGGSVVSSPVVANGYVYVGSNDDYLYAFDLSEA
ncbi:MAG: PQQ-binding-like beta-propeller repeat protein [Ktedonobacteraceae bacterium]